MALLDAVLALTILLNVVLVGVALECARKLSARFFVLPLIWGVVQRHCPGFVQLFLGFVEIWDQFRTSTHDFDSRFAVFCDQLGDYLEGILQSLLDVLERLFASDAEDEAHRLRRVPCHRVTDRDLLEGVGPLRICTCPICLEDWRLGDEVRVLPACRHAFHRKCVDGWLSHGALCRHECPMCRTPVRLR